MAEFASLADVKTHLNLTSSANDGELTLMLDAAEDVVRSIVGSFTAVAVTERVAATGGTVLLSRHPQGEVTLTRDGVAVDGFTTNSAAGLIYDVPSGYGQLVASYSAGPGVVPAAVKLATLIITSHLWETQRGASPSALSLQQPDADPFVGGVGFAIPNRARELLDPYIRPVSIA